MNVCGYSECYIILSYKNRCGFCPKHRRKMYYHTEGGKKTIINANNRYNQSELGKKTRWIWRLKNKHKLKIKSKKSKKKYLSTEKGHNSRLKVQTKYNNSEKGKASRLKYRKNNSNLFLFDKNMYDCYINVRKRDNNTCQWNGCKSNKNIHIHHIFPKSEYPELKYIEKYMICYCKEHHSLFHQARGDRCWKMILINK